MPERSNGLAFNNMWPLIICETFGTTCEAGTAFSGAAAQQPTHSPEEKAPRTQLATKAARKHAPYRVPYRDLPRPSATSTRPYHFSRNISLADR